MLAFVDITDPDMKDLPDPIPLHLSDSASCSLELEELKDPIRKQCRVLGRKDVEYARQGVKKIQTFAEAEFKANDPDFKERLRSMAKELKNDINNRIDESTECVIELTTKASKKLETLKFTSTACSLAVYGKYGKSGNETEMAVGMAFMFQRWVIWMWGQIMDSFKSFVTEIIEGIEYVLGMIVVGFEKFCEACKCLYEGVEKFAEKVFHVIKNLLS